MVIGYTTGVFDLFHIGHLNILQRSRANCDYLIVGVTTDELCQERKGRMPVIPFDERSEIVKNIKCVDSVVVQTDMDKIKAWKAIGFQKMFVGDDWKGSPEWEALEKEFRRHNVEITYFPYTRHTSSTLLIKALNNLVGD
jgi:glycerol-3-phosphate cytidylyltransferase